ncbi:MAG: transposase [Anaerolineae bacterium]
MSEARRRYTAEFKREVLGLLRSSGKGAAQIERELGIGDGCLLRWKKYEEAAGEQAFPGIGRLGPEQQRIRELERENEVLRQERDIQKKQWPSSRTQTDEIPVHSGEQGGISDPAPVSDDGRLDQWIRCLEQAPAQWARDGQPRSGRAHAAGAGRSVTHVREPAGAGGLAGPGHLLQPLIHHSDRDSQYMDRAYGAP